MGLDGLVELAAPCCSSRQLFLCLSLLPWDAGCPLEAPHPSLSLKTQRAFLLTAQLKFVAPGWDCTCKLVFLPFSQLADQSTTPGCPLTRRIPGSALELVEFGSSTVPPCGVFGQ